MWFKNINSKKGGDGMCLAWDTGILTESGADVAISQLDPTKHAIAYLGKDGKRHFTKRYKVAKTGEVDTIRVLTLKDKRRLRVTPGHRIASFLLYSDLGFQYVPVKNLTGEDSVWCYHQHDPVSGYDLAEIQNIKVLSVEQQSYTFKDVWDIENQEECYRGEPNFFANGVLVHNCVFTSFEFCCLWSGLDEFRGFRDWCAANYPGGGYPSKLAQLVKAYCKAKAIPPSRFDPDTHLIQYEGDDPSWVEKALKNGWLPCITLFHSPRYGGGTIYHMVCCAHMDEKWIGILDNNFQPLEWSTREEGLRRIKDKGKYWAVAVITAGPPPCPTN